MTKIDIFSGFLGAGKTTLIKKLIAQAYTGEKLVLIENEFGEIGIDGGFLQDAGIHVTEMNSGCICCSLVGDFGKALQQVLETYTPDRVLIEPSGVGKLSDVIAAVRDLHMDNVTLNSYTAVVDAKKCKMYMKNFGEFFNNQIESARAIVLSHTDGLDVAKIDASVQLIREKNATATVITTPWEQLSGAQILSALENANTLEHALHELKDEVYVCPQCGGHHHEHEHHHEYEHHHHEHEHHHHEHEHHHDGECDCGFHHDHHDHHDHEHHHHHHADEVFTSWGKETARRFDAAQLRDMVAALEDEERFGTVLRAKGIVQSTDGGWLHFDYVPGEPDVRVGCADVTGRLCVIGADLHTDALAELFGIEE